MAWFGRKKRRGAGASRRREPAVPGAWKIAWGPRLRWLGVLLALGIVGVGTFVGYQKLYDPNAFPLRNVRVEGELRNLEKRDLEPFANESLGRNFFTVNLDTLHATLSTNPWIAAVAVQRWWPDTIEIHLRERVAFGYWGENGEMVDVNGQRFHPTVLRQPGPWPKLSGPDGREKPLINTWQEVQALFEPLGLKLAQLKQDDRRAWLLTFDNGLEVHVGREHFQDRLQRLARVYPRVLADQVDRIAVVDLRYVNGFVVRWKTGSPTPAAT